MGRNAVGEETRFGVIRKTALFASHAQAELHVFADLMKKVNWWFQREREIHLSCMFCGN
jgi:hypothetical protein